VLAAFKDADLRSWEYAFSEIPQRSTRRIMLNRISKDIPRA